MHIIDSELERRAAASQLIKVGIVGAGAMSRGVALQLLRYCPGFHLAVVCNRRIERAESLYRDAGVEKISYPTSVATLDRDIERGLYCITDDATLLCESNTLDVIVEITGAVEFGAHVVLNAIRHKKHVVLMNAELDSTVGSVLKNYADEQGVIITNVDGDQPGVIMNLYRFVKGIGVKPVLCGNVKGLQDPYRTPLTQKSFAERWNQSAPMVTSFADGTKISFEQSLVANATNMRVAKRGMFGPQVEPGEHVDNAEKWFPIDLLDHPTGIVDYVVGANPGPGVFVLGSHSDPKQQHFLELYKLGTGPLYTFYTPYHLCHFEVHNTIARAVIFKDAAITPTFGPCVDVITTAKRDLKEGEVLDGIGHFMTYGQCENSETVVSEKLLPIGQAEGCVLTRDMPKDSVITHADVKMPAGRLVDSLRQEQDRTFFNKTEAL